MALRVINADTPYEGPGKELGAGAASPSVGGPLDLHTTFHSRALYWSPFHQEIQRCVDIYNGVIPEEYSDLVDGDKLFHLINMFRLSADDLAGMAGQEFPLFSREDNDSQKAKTAAEKREHIMYGYNAAGRLNGGVDMAGLATVHGWWMAVAGASVGLVLPDHRRKTPYFTFRNPTTHFPPVGWNQWEQSDLDGTLFAYQMTLGELKRRYPDKAQELDIAHTKSTHAHTTGWKPTASLEATGSGDEDLRMLWVGEYYHSDAWYVVTLEENGVVLLASESGDRGHPGVCSAVGYQVYNPDQVRGLLADQIGLQIAESRMLSQQLHHNDRMTDPPIFGSKLMHDKIRYGPNAYNPFDETIQKPSFFQASPPNQIHTQQMMELGMVLLRMLNRNPESFQGAGEANSAKAVSELKSGVSETVKRVLWPPFFQGHPQLYGKAIRMDINLWGQERKPFAGTTPEKHRRKRAVPIMGSYRPIADLAGYEDSIEIEPGIIFRGYQGRLEIMQLVQSGLMSEDTAFEQMDVVREPQLEKRKVQVNRLEQLEFADIATRAQKGEVLPGAITKLMTMMEKDGIGLFEAKAKLEEKGEFYAPPPAPPGMAPPGMPGLPGAPAMAALGPGPDPAQLGESLEQGATAPPALDVIQGGLANAG